MQYFLKYWPFYPLAMQEEIVPHTILIPHRTPLSLYLEGSYTFKISSSLVVQWLIKMENYV
jgi:hypothetical protein